LQLSVEWRGYRDVRSSFIFDISRLSSRTCLIVEPTESFRLERAADF